MFHKHACRLRFLGGNIVAMTRVVAFLTMLLTACASGPSAHEQAMMMERQDNAYCVNLGFTPRTEAYGNCRIQRTNQRIMLMQQADRIQICDASGGLIACY